MTITPLGAGQEVGRSCHLLEFRGLTILLDCGIHPGYDGISGLPFFDRVEPEKVDVLLITHFHLDHAGECITYLRRFFPLFRLVYCVAKCCLNHRTSYDATC